MIDSPISQATTMENARKWLNIIRYGESGTVVQLQDDCEYRVLEITENPKILKEVLGPYYRRFLFDYLPLDEKDLHETIKLSLIGMCIERKIAGFKALQTKTNDEIIKIIAKKGYEIGLFISHIIYFLKRGNLQPLIDLELLIRSNRNLSVIFFSEQDLFHQKYRQLTDKCSFLFDNYLLYPLYGEKDSRQFIHYYLKQWQFTLSEEKINQLVQACGGYLWLLHQAIRNLRNNPDISLDQALTDKLMLIKLETIWGKLTDSEKEIIRKVFFGSLSSSDTISRDYEYLCHIRLIRENNKHPSLGIPLFASIIEKENKINRLSVKSGNINLGGRDVSSFFSKKERNLLLLLLSSRKKINSRDTVAQSIWGGDWQGKYSDWAIDRLAYRIRNKLKALGIDESLFKTVKKKGFIFG